MYSCGAGTFFETVIDGESVHSFKFFLDQYESYYSNLDKSKYT